MKKGTAYAYSMYNSGLVWNINKRRQLCRRFPFAMTGKNHAK
ncbi:hypothetical protein HMPREF0322_03849 [Desulfitobacterium hafniense DP7]|uniref:Uncharacterized protein n=1 Tax=Desulfitobacterium hafniense DP7 TaxID=537010 RepID=G9XSA0_DESHA|nr:hypothetical protein HMPREF0322_03849 [Desulfitobacterium hafniense DP7]